MTTAAAAYYSLPTYDQPIMMNGVTSKSMYRFMQNVYQGAAPTAETVITPTGSPFIYQAIVGGFMIVQGGTVSLLQFVRASTHTLPGTSGVFPLSRADQLIITYSGAPNLIFVPQ
jgi:hypothetical protein